MKQVPPYLSTREIAVACGAETRDMYLLLRKAGLLERIGGGHPLVDETRLRETLPTVYARVYLHYCGEDNGIDTNRQDSTELTDSPGTS